MWNALEQPLQCSRSPRELSQTVQNPNRMCLIAHSEQNQSPAGMDSNFGCRGVSTYRKVREKKECMCTLVSVCVWVGVCMGVSVCVHLYVTSIQCKSDQVATSTQPASNL